MYRQGPDSPRSFAGHDIPKASGEVRRRAKKLPAGSQLPDGWNEDMDRAICHMDALNDIDPKKIPGVLKRRFPDIIGRDIISEDAIQRRIETLEQQDNDYFKAGMHTAVMRAEANGFVLPPYDPDNYPSKYYRVKTDLEIFGSGEPMTGNLGYGATIVSESEQAARSVRKITINNRSKVPDRQNTPGQSPARRLTTRDEGLGARRVQIGMGFPSSETADDNGTNAIPTAGRYAHPHDLTDVSNSYNAPGLLPATTYSYSSPSKPATNIHRERSAANVPLPTTPVNSQGNQYFSTPSSRDKARSRGDASTPYRNQHLSTPTSKERTRSRSETGDTPRAGSSSTGLYRSGKENATSSMSTSTTGTIMLGRDIPGMQAALDRRHARVDHRRTAED